MEQQPYPIVFLKNGFPFYIYEDNFPLESSFPLCYTENGFLILIA